MPYVANEAVHTAYWNNFPLPEKAAWPDQFATLRSKYGPAVTPEEAYRQAELAYSSEGFCQPRLALAVFLTFGPLKKPAAASSP